MGVHVTQHAIDRFREWVGDVPDDDARRSLRCPIVQMAVEFAGNAECFVRLATGQRITIRGGVVITVLPAENYKRHVRRKGMGRYE